MSRPILALIAAVAANGTIGKDGGMPWSMPADMSYFKHTTLGRPVIMGRRTWESLSIGDRAPQPLLGRRNIVITSQAGAVFPGAETASSLEAALALCDGEKQVFCIGGAVLYREALPHADALYLTEIQQDFEGDTFFPQVDRATWREVYRLPQTQAHEPLSFDFVIYVR
jgi:dihydrofolate reductase